MYISLITCSKVIQNNQVSQLCNYAFTDRYSQNVELIYPDRCAWCNISHLMGKYMGKGIFVKARYLKNMTGTYTILKFYTKDENLS